MESWLEPHSPITSFYSAGGRLEGKSEGLQWQFGTSLLICLLDSQLVHKVTKRLPREMWKKKMCLYSQGGVWRKGRSAKRSLVLASDELTCQH